MIKKLLISLFDLVFPPEENDPPPKTWQLIAFYVFIFLMILLFASSPSLL